MKKLFSIILFFVAVAVGLQAEVVWNDEPHNVGSWNSLQLLVAEYPLLTSASAGDVIAITVSNVGENASILLQSPTSPDWTNIESIGLTQAGRYPFALTSESVSLLNTVGLAINGQNFTITKVELLYQLPLWTGSADGNSSGWAETSTVDKSKFASLSEGSYVGINVGSVNNPGGWHAFTLRAGNDWSALSSVAYYDNTEAKTYLYTLSADNVTALQGSDIINVAAQNLEVTGLYIYMDYKYYVTGLDENWNTCAYPMSLVDGVYSYTHTSLFGTQGFKVTRGIWDYQWNYNNIDAASSDVDLSDGGDSNIKFTAYGEIPTITFNPANSKVVVKCDLSTVVAVVAGSEVLFGTDWDGTNTNNKMTVENGVLTWTAENFYATEDTHVEFKVVIKKSATEDAYDWYPYANYQHTFAPGHHDVTITINWKQKTTVELTDNNYPIIRLAGTFNPSWDGEEMTFSHDDYTCSITKTIANAGVYAFKLIENATWRTDQYSAQMDRTNCTDWSFSYTNDANNTLLIDLPGDYTFTYTYEGKLLSITGFPTSFSRPASANYGSLCVPFDAELTNGRAFQITSREGDVVTITEPENIVAGHAYIIKAIDPAQPILISKKAEGDAVAAPVHDAYHYGVLGNTVTVTASYEAYVLMDNELRKVEGEGEVTVASTKAYFKLPASSLAPSALRIVEAENNTTDVKSVEANEKAVKFLENGQLRILRDGVVYDATGRVVR